jgi:predicted dehydrogenase
MPDPARTPERPLRGAIVGYGFIAEHGHLPAYALAGPGEFEIVAVADSCAARRARAHAALPHARVYEGHERLLEAEVACLDFIDVATPPSDHARVARAALVRGLHVLCEEPLATTVEDARGMLGLAREARRVLFPCHDHRHAPVIRTVRRLLDLGLLGPVRLVTLQTFRATHARGADEWRPDWRRERRYAGGGVAMDHGSHAFYLAFDWLGAYPTAITAKASTFGPFDTEDNFACALTFPGGTASAHLSWTAGVQKVVYTIHGERGAVRVEDDDVEVALAHGAPGVWHTTRERIASAWRDASHVGWLRALFGELAAAIRTGDVACREAEESVRCVELVTAAYASARDASREQALAGGR